MIGKFIYNRLVSDINVAAVVQTRIYPDIVPQDVQYPFVVYTIVNATPVNYKDGISNLEEIRVQIDVYTNDYDETDTLTNDIRNRFDRFSGTVEGVDITTVTYLSAETNRFEPDINVYWKSSEFLIKMKR